MSLKRYVAPGILVSLLIVIGSGSCDFFTQSEEAGKGTLLISLGRGSGAQRAITSGADLPAEILAAFRYELTLTGPEGETLERTHTDGEALTLTVTLGDWRIDAKAYQEDGLAGTGSRTFAVMPGFNYVQVPMQINGGYFAIVVSSMSGGTAAANFPAAFPGATITLTVTPNTGYALKGGTLKYSHGGSDYPFAGGPPYTFAMPAADVMVSAEFEALPPDTYSVTPASMTNGSVNPDAASATAGTTITLTVTPNTGYALKAGTLKYRYGGSDYTPSGSGLTYTFAMPAADVTVSAEFEALPPDTYSVTPASMTGGAVNPNAASATAGTTITLTVTPNAGYTLKTGTLKYSHGGSDYPLTGGPPYTFAMPAANVTVSAEFKLDNNAALTIEVFRDEAASVRPEHSAGHTPPTDISWGSGESVIFTLDSSDYTAEAGTLKWFVNGTEKTATGNSLTIKARDYVKRSYTLTVMIKYGGQWYSADAGFRVTE